MKFFRKKKKEEPVPKTLLKDIIIPEQIRAGNIIKTGMLINDSKKPLVSITQHFVEDGYEFFRYGITIVSADGTKIYWNEKGRFEKPMELGNRKMVLDVTDNLDELIAEYGDIAVTYDEALPVRFEKKEEKL